MDAVETYFTAIRDIWTSGAGVDETSYYPALAALLTELGQTLKPKVRCIINPANRGAGIPDGGLYTAEQFERGAPQAAPAGQMPARGVVEAKPFAADLTAIAQSQQVRRYLGLYGLVLVTNFREFRLLVPGPNGEPRALEVLSVADGADAFVAALRHPRALADRWSERLGQFLCRAMLHKAPVSRPRDLAWFLASYARDARLRLEEQPDLPGLDAVRAALEDSLGIKFEGAKGEHFFRSTLVQTLFYGVFSAWVLWHGERDSQDGEFDWHTSAWHLHLPVMQALYQHVAMPATLSSLGLSQLLDLAAGVLNRVDQGAFFAAFERERAVQYFYEPFLEAYDPVLRDDLGVWYTPPEVVRYMVARVDTVLREELGIADGLADDQVYVLDPCCGTGAFLVETLRVIAETLRARGEDALLGEAVKRAATERVFGFEILPAPFVVAHLQLGLFLREQGAALPADGPQRPAVYLTNALTGWEPGGGRQGGAA